jgi:hypothetical protein
MSVICSYCQSLAEYVDSSEVYNGRSYGMIYLCRPCRAWVGVHKGTDKPLGRLANKDLREWKIKAHAAFDPLWKAKMRQGHSKKSARNSGYAWLAEQMGIPREACHVGMFDVEQCKQVVEICSPYLRRAA